MKKGAKIALVALIIIIALAVGGLYYLGFISMPQAGAKLTAMTGAVEVDSGTGFKPATPGMDLHMNDMVMAGPGASAEIIFFGSSVTRLDENTQVKISDLIDSSGKRTVVLDQAAGNTWNRVLLASGIDTYEVKTPTSIASVRGTAFFVRIVNGRVDVGVTEGKIDLKSLKDKNVVAVIQVEMNKTAVIDPLTLDRIEVKPLVKDEWVNQNEQKDIQLEKNVKEKIKSKYGGLIEIAKSQYSITDEQIDYYIDAYVSGQYTKEDIGALKKQYGINIDLEI